MIMYKQHPLNMNTSRIIESTFNPQALHRDQCFGHFETCQTGRKWFFLQPNKILFSVYITFATISKTGPVIERSTADRELPGLIPTLA